MTLSNIINWFEIPVTDFERAKKFYETILGITMPTTHTGGYSMGFFPNVADKVGGAICYGEGYIPSGAGSVLYLNADPDLFVALSKVPEAGGKVLVTKTLISEENGYYAFILDSEGNRIGLQSMH
jgi:uncharacterized protein